MLQLFEIIFHSSRSYHGRNFPPRKSTPSVNIASAWGASLSLVVCGSRFFGHEKVPSSSRLVSTHKPVPSQQRIFIRVWRRLLNTNKAPARGSSPSRSVTSACRPLKPLRRSQASTATNTFRLPEKLSMAFPATAATRRPAAPVLNPPLQGAPRPAIESSAWSSHEPRDLALPAPPLRASARNRRAWPEPGPPLVCVAAP